MISGTPAANSQIVRMCSDRADSSAVAYANVIPNSRAVYASRAACRGSARCPNTIASGPASQPGYVALARGTRIEVPAAANATTTNAPSAIEESAMWPARALTCTGTRARTSAPMSSHAAGSSARRRAPRAGNEPAAGSATEPSVPGSSWSMDRPIIPASL